MRAEEVFTLLSDRGKANTVRIYGHHGVTGKRFGVSFGDLKTIERRLGKDASLFEPLWRSAYLEARLLALRLVAVTDFTSEDLERLLASVDNPMLTDGFSAFVVAHPQAPSLSDAWIARDHERQEATGWTLSTLLVLKDRLDDERIAHRLSLIEKDIHGAKNRVRHSMNNCLIAIGGHTQAFYAPACRIAKTIGKVDVDHGLTNCKTPAALPYIEKMVKRRLSRKRKAE